MWTTDFKYKLSIIIPLYNAERFIARCLDSLLATELPEDKLEIIVVNDGSKDKGAAIVEQYAEKHSNISLYHQENQGQSVARNLAISKATGDYLWCVDSDDYIDPINFRKAYERLCKVGGLDILMFAMYIQLEQEEKYPSPLVHHYGYDKILKGRDVILQDYLPGTMCTSFIKAELFSKYNFSFYPKILGQDAELNYKIMAYAEKVYFLDVPVYVYYMNEGSATNTPSPERRLKRFKDIVTVGKSYQQFAQEVLATTNDRLLSERIQRTGLDNEFGVVYNLFKNRKEFKKNGMYFPLLKDLQQRVLPLAPPYKTWKHHCISIFFNWYFK